MFTTWQWILMGLLAVALVLLDLFVRYRINLRALDRGFGRGRDATDWATRGMGGAYTYSVLAPPEEKTETEGAMEVQVCPKCGETRRVYDGFCTACGSNVLDALIEQAKAEEQQGRQ